MLDPFNKVPDTLKAKPERLDAGFAVTLSGEETAKHGDSPDHLAQRGRRFRDGFFGQDVRAFSLLGSEEKGRGEVRMRSPQAEQSGQSPRDNPIDGQHQFNLADAAELQGFDPTAVLEHVIQLGDILTDNISPVK